MLKESKRFRNCEQVLLYRGSLQLEIGTLDAMRNDGGAHEDPLTLGDLAAILALTAGIREINGEAINRWAATAGNCGSVELFVAARSVDGLGQGIYLYQPEEHSLARFRKRDSLEISEFMCRVLGLGEDVLPDALILFTGAFHRLARKYGSFGYRLINLDAGAALSQLHLVARSLNLHARTATKWADDLIQEQLNLNVFDEQPTAVIEISGSARKKKRLVPILHRRDPELNWPASHKSVGEFRA
jgi:SagB-type dehydrogenase family enzyme